MLRALLNATIVRQTIRTGQPLVSIEEKERLPAGKFRWVSTTKLPLRDRDGDIVRILGLSHDITQRKLYGKGADQTFSYERYVSSFEITRLARQYMNYATLRRTVRWVGRTPDAPAVTRVAARRDRKPDDNRRVRNRI